MSRKEIILFSLNDFIAINNNIVNFLILHKQVKRREGNVVIGKENNISIIISFLHMEEIIRIDIINLILI